MTELGIDNVVLGVMIANFLTIMFLYGAVQYSRLERAGEDDRTVGLLYLLLIVFPLVMTGLMLYPIVG